VVENSLIMNNSLEINNIIIAFDRIATQLAYKGITLSAIKYLSGDGLNRAITDYLKIKNEIFIPEFRNLLVNLGVDIDKENDYIHYATEENSITEIKFDFIGLIEGSISTEPWFYEISNMAVNIHFNNNQYGRHKVFSEKQSSRIEITIVQGIKTRDNTS